MCGNMDATWFSSTGSHISEVLQENEALRQRVELLQLQAEKEKEALQADATQAKEALCRYLHVSEQMTQRNCEGTTYNVAL